jgi:hypothetical protein
LTPFEFLGLAADADERAVKRAYARLLKINRPDENPQGFAALHTIYRAALQYVQWRDARLTAAPGQGGASPPGSSRESGAGPPPPVVPPSPPSVVPPAPSPVVPPAPPPAALAPPLPPLQSPPSPAAVPPFPAPSPVRRPAPPPPAGAAHPVAAAMPLPRIAVHELQALVREIHSLLEDPGATPFDVARRLAADELQPFVVREAVEDALLRALATAATAATAPDAGKLRVLVSFFGWEQAAAGAAIGSPAALRRRNAARAIVTGLYAAEHAAERAAAAQRKAAAEALALHDAAVKRAEEAFAGLAAPRRVKQLLQRLRRGAAPERPSLGIQTLQVPMDPFERWLRAAFIDRQALDAALNSLRRHGGTAAMGLFHGPTRDFFAAVASPRAPLGKLLALHAIRATLAACGVSLGVALALTAAAAVDAGEKLAAITFGGIFAFISVFLGSFVVDAMRRERRPAAPESPAAAQRRRRGAAWLGGAGAAAALIGSALSVEPLALLGAAVALLAAALQFRRSGNVTGAAVFFALGTFPADPDRLGALSPLIYAATWFLVERRLARGRLPAGGLRAAALLLLVLLVTAGLLVVASGRLAEPPHPGSARPPAARAASGGPRGAAAGPRRGPSNRSGRP